MKIFLDSINLEQIRKYQELGVIDGITTNPSLMSGSQNSILETAKEIASIVDGDISVEVISSDFDGMKKEGDEILSLAPNMVVKLPITWDGLRACRYFSDKGRKVNMTLCFSVNQAFLAAKYGASYVSPFIGRLEDVGADGVELIDDIKNIYSNYDFETQILAASIRSTDHVKQALLCGADIVTLPEKILDQLVSHQLTDIGLEKFSQDWRKSGKKFRI